MIINSYRYATGGGASDVTPNALAASYTTEFDDLNDIIISVAQFQITGIDTTITLRANYTQGNYDIGAWKAYYVITDTSTQEEATDPVTYGQALVDTGTFTITNGKWINILSGPFAFSEDIQDSITIRNVSDSNALLTTVNAYTYNTP